VEVVAKAEPPRIREFNIVLYAFVREFAVLAEVIEVDDGATFAARSTRDTVLLPINPFNLL
jgi:hypothetical protein